MSGTSQNSRSTCVSGRCLELRSDMGYKRNTASSSRIKHLENLLEPGEALNFDVYKAVEKICGRELTEVDDNLLKELDDAINRYLNCAIEYDRLTRRRSK